MPVGGRPNHCSINGFLFSEWWQIQSREYRIQSDRAIADKSGSETNAKGEFSACGFAWATSLILRKRCITQS